MYQKKVVQIMKTHELSGNESGKLKKYFKDFTICVAHMSLMHTGVTRTF